MRPFRKVSPQLAWNSVDVHFSRYDLTKEEDCQIFRSVLWALQRQLPVEEVPLLTEQHWEMLYARSIGCIGLLKLHLHRALALALGEGAKTVTQHHLRQTAMSEMRVRLVLRNALESETVFSEASNADEQLPTLLRKPPARITTSAEQKPESVKQDQEHASSPPKNQRPGKHTPGRDAIGLEGEEDAPTEGERVAG